MSAVRSVCVFCGASSAVPAAHLAAAEALGRLLAARGETVVYGGGHVGMMGRLADGALQAGGRVVGIIPRHLMDRERAHLDVSELVVAEDMHSRKAEMYRRADAIVSLPGGIGTVDETVEIMTWRQLGLHAKPMVLVNLDGYWDPFLAMLDRMLALGYLQAGARAMLRVVPDIAAVPAACESGPA